MSKKKLQKYLPERSTIENNKLLSWLGEALFHRRLWSINRRSIAMGAAVGSLAMWLPVFPQTLLAAALAILARANVPLSVALVFITNPFTIPPMFYGAYRVGAWIQGLPIEPMPKADLMQLFEMAKSVYPSLFIGAFVLGIITAIIAYVTVRLLWRLNIVRRWESRRRG